MLSDKIFYMLAVGVLAVGVGHRYVKPGKTWIQCAINEVNQMAQEAPARVAAFVTEGELRASDRGNRVEDRVNSRLQVMLARVQSRVDRTQMQMDRRNAEVARVNAAVERVNAGLACVRTKLIMKSKDCDGAIKVATSEE